MKKILALLGICATLLFTAADALARSAPLDEKSYSFDLQTPVTAEKVRDYILSGASRYKELVYKVESDAPGALQLEFNKENDHYVSVLFSYDQAGFQTTYVKSVNLNYEVAKGVRTIHPNYMVWLDEMFVHMKRAASMTLDSKGIPTEPSAAAHMTFVTAGSNESALFSMTDETSDCGKLENLGWLSSKGPGPTIAAQLAENAEWNAQNKADIAAKKASKKTSVTQYPFPSYIESQRPLQLSAYTSWRYGDTTVSCGPIVFGLVPQGGKKYTAEFHQRGNYSRHGGCALIVFDDTDPELRVPVPNVELKFKECKKRFFFF